jgi:hypothetical protein
MKHQCVTADFPTRRGEPPPGNANAAQPGRWGGAASNQKRKAQRNAYRPRPRLLQVGGAR